MAAEGTCSWAFYVLECVDGTLYAGITTNLDARFQAHLRGKGARYTRAHKPLFVKCTLTCEAFEDKGAALRVEAAFKKLKRPKKEEFMRGEGEAFQQVLKILSPHPAFLFFRIRSTRGGNNG